MTDVDAIRDKYKSLSRSACLRSGNLYDEMKKAEVEASLDVYNNDKLKDHEDAKSDYLVSKNIAQIYGRICSDLGDGDSYLPDAI